MKVAIHQPNFLPWLGFFRKIALADKFIFLDSAIYSKGSWINRVRCIVGNEPRWITCPIIHGNYRSLISTITFDERQPWRKRLVCTFQANYAKSKYFNDVMDWLVPLIETPSTNLSAYNINIIKKICGILSLDCIFFCQSDLISESCAKLTGSEMLSSLCCEVNATCYLAGDGASGYETEKSYLKAGIALDHSDFKPFSYPQHGVPGFVSGLSIIDALFNISADEIRKELYKKKLITY